MFQKAVSLVASVPRRLSAVVALLVAFVVGSPAMAVTTFDTTSVTDTITAVVTAAALIGAAALAMHYGIRAWKWLRGAG